MHIPGKQLNFLMQNHVCTKRPSTAATSRGTFNADVHLDQHSTTQKRPAAAAPQPRSPTSQCSPQSLRGSVRPASAGVTLRGGKAVTGHAALFKPGGLLAGLVQARFIHQLVHVSMGQPHAWHLWYPIRKYDRPWWPLDPPRTSYGSAVVCRVSYCRTYHVCMLL